MVEMLKNNKLAVGTLAVLVAVGAWYFLGGSGGGEPVLVTEDLSAPSSQVERDLVATLLQLRSVSLDGTILGDPTFQSLKDFGSEIVPEPVGRENPFAPLESQKAAAGQTKTGTSTTASTTTPTKTAPPKGR